jgi:hypothetical protein
MSARPAILFTALLLLTACSFNFERSSEIRDRRILAIQADPPELAGGTSRPSSVQLRALVVDPGDPLAAAETVWRSCIIPATGGFPDADGDGEGRFGSSSRLCPEGDATVLHASGSQPISSLSQSIPVPEEVGEVLASGADVAAPQIQVQLSVSSERGELVAIKEVTVTARLPEEQEPNRNPAIQGLSLDGTEWLPDGARTIRYGDCPDEQKEQVEAEDGSLVRVCEHDLEPLFDEAEAQFYKARGFSGELEVQRERLQFAWFTDAGSFREGRTEQFDPRDPSPDNVGPKNSWREPPSKVERATLWVVVRDGRGGTTWTRREVLFE